MKIKTLIWILVMILVIPNVVSMGVSPGRRTFNFNPGEKHEVVLNIHKSDLSNEYYLQVNGELKDYITLENYNVIFSQNETVKQVKYYIEIPEFLLPGIRESTIHVSIKKNEDYRGTQIKVLPIVISQVWVKVPYSGKNLAIENIEIIEPRNLETVNIKVAVENIGDAILEKVFAELLVLDSENNEVVELETNVKENLEPAKRAILETKWVPDILPGNYDLKSVVNYDNFEIERTVSFTLGEPIINIKKIQNDNFKLGDVALIKLILESEWNEEIKDVYADLTFKKDNYVRTIRTTSTDLDVGKEEVIEGYWDTKGLSEGEYELNVLIYALDKEIEKTYFIMVTDDNFGVVKQITGAVVDGKKSITKNELIALIAYGIIFAFIIVNLLWFYKNFKKRNM